MGTIRSDFDLFRKANTPVVAVVDTNFGDNGKGKFVDLLAEFADVTVRGTGGENAGHTIVHDGVTHVFHLLPSSISRDAEGKVSIIGRGTVINPGSFDGELQLLEERGMSWNGLRASQDAQLVLPWHIALDRVRETLAGSGKIGTTGKGIGPAYAAHRARVGVRVNDLLNPDLLRESVAQSYREATAYFDGVPPYILREAVRKIDGAESFYRAKGFFSVATVTEWLIEKSLRFRDCITDTDALVQKMLNEGKRVLLEGAQGVLLSIDCGTYPFVTSSDCSINGLAQGSGLRTEDVGYAVSIVKAYASRVGEGPFPTELRGEEAENLRHLGNEFGATTGRPRRVGWLDLPLLRYAVRHASRTFALTKADVLAEYGIVKVCTHYLYRGPDRRVGDRLLRRGERIDIADPYPWILEHCEPQYREFKGWGPIPTGATRSKKCLPPALQEFIVFIEEEVGARVELLSVGPDREDTIAL